MLNDKGIRKTNNKISIGIYQQKDIYHKIFTINKKKMKNHKKDQAMQNQRREKDINGKFMQYENCFCLTE
jgi:hypothetical protein